MPWQFFSKHGWCRLLFAAALTLTGLTAAAQNTARVSFDLPSDVAATSLKNFARQSGLEVLISADLGRSIRTQPVRGEYTPIEAVERMLLRTGLVAKQDAKTGAMIIKLEESAISPAGTDSLNDDPASSPKKKTKP